MPNVSASLSDEAYLVWQDYPGKKSPWISELIIQGDELFLRWRALDKRCNHLQGIISELLLELFLSRGGAEGYIPTQEQVIIWNKSLETLEGTLLRANFQELTLPEEK